MQNFILNAANEDFIFMDTPLEGLLPNVAEPIEPTGSTSMNHHKNISISEDEKENSDPEYLPQKDQNLDSDDSEIEGTHEKNSIETENAESDVEERTGRKRRKIMCKNDDKR